MKDITPFLHLQNQTLRLPAPLFVGKAVPGTRYIAHCNKCYLFSYRISPFNIFVPLEIAHTPGILLNVEMVEIIYSLQKHSQAQSFGKTIFLLRKLYFLHIYVEHAL